ncbi:MAG: VOC family protein [Roseobacter sp.]
MLPIVPKTVELHFPNDHLRDLTVTARNSVKLDYLEFTSPFLEETQNFFAQAFGWEYIDYGSDYRDIQNAGLGGGIERGPSRAPLPVLVTDDLEGMLDTVEKAGGEITVGIFEFPGGRRFQFREPGGSEMAVWSKV